MRITRSSSPSSSAPEVTRRPERFSRGLFRSQGNLERRLFIFGALSKLLEGRRPRFELESTLLDRPGANLEGLGRSSFP